MAAALAKGAEYLLLQLRTFGAPTNSQAVTVALVAAHWTGVCFAFRLIFVSFL